MLMEYNDIRFLQLIRIINLIINLINKTNHLCAGVEPEKKFRMG